MTVLSMSRSVSSTISSAVAKEATAPVYLLAMGFASTVRVATWDSAISWDGQTWSASGARISNLSSNGCRLILPTGESDPWLALVLGEGTRDVSISIYEHHTDATASPTTDAVLVFSGTMDEATITDNITIKVIESSRQKTFPPDSVDQPTFTHLLTSGDVITWGNNVTTVR